MLIRTIDIGNSFVKIVDFDNGHKVGSTRFEINDIREITSYLENLRFDHLCFCSVDSDFSKDIKMAINDLNRGYFELRIDNFPLKIDYQTKPTLGVDRLAAAYGAYTIYTTMPIDKAIVIDLGTAITCDIVDIANGIYEGGVIMSGYNAIYESLQKRAKSLSEFEIPAIDREISFPAKNTRDCIGLGLRLQTEMAIENLLDEYIGRHKKLNIRVVITGGQGRNLKMNRIYDYEPDLVHIGLKSAFQKQIGEI